jgi:hypothetical protein
MAATSVLRVAGNTQAISVTASSSTALLIKAGYTNDQVNFASVLNTGSVPVAVKFGDSAVVAAVFPVAGSTEGDYVLPALMTRPVILAVPAAPFYVRAIGSAAGPSILYVTPIGDQS